MNTVNAGDNTYDFTNEENSTKWKGLLTAALKRVLEQVHPSLAAKDDALEYVENLCLRLLGMLCAKPSPHTVQDVEYKVQATFPNPIDKWALKEAHEAMERGRKKCTLLLPVDKIHSLLQKELLLYKVENNVSIFLVAVLEYISADILKLAGNYVRHIKHVEITPQDVKISMNADKALMDMFYQDDSAGPVLPTESLIGSNAPRSSLTYEEVVRELIASEKAYIKELHMIIKVFREEIIKVSSDPLEIELIFSNIMDIYELTYTLLGSLEDVIEMAQDQMSYIGSCFEELAEAAEFDVYIRYARDVTAPACRDTLNALLGRPKVEHTLTTAGQGMRLALKYYLPALLMGPIRHCFSYLEYIQLLRGLSVAPEDRETLTQVEGLLTPLQTELSRCVPTPALLRNCSTPFLQIRARRQAALDKLHDIEKNVESWDPKDLGQCCNEYIREDVLMKISSGKRLTERRVFLFDGLVILCKPNSRRQSSAHQNHPECRLKERFFIRKVEIVDHQDTEDTKNAFEIAPRHTQPSVVLCTKTAEEKNSWMADLIMLNTRSMLERILDSILSDIERKHPLKLPPPSLYKFAEPDSKDNIVLEQRENGGVPLIKGATIYKLIERLTYHIYADPKFVRTFLTTYRSFCSPKELLDLLIERFQIPDPSLVYEQDCCDTDKMQKNNQREDWKKYRKEYCQPVQFRVLNVLRHWVDHHFYDFERDPELLVKLHSFLDSVNGKNMRKWVDSVLKILQRKVDNDTQRHIKFAVENPPPIEWHLPCTEEEYGILTLHPIEIARQLTILEFDLYEKIKPSELVGSVWTKKDKETSSPNLLKMIKHTTNVTRWLEKNIVEAENYEERVAILNRIIEIMIVLSEINNFNGVLSIISMCGSASVHRLKFTFQALTQQNKKALEEYRADDLQKKYQEKLRSINPPCVPFLGTYLTNILFIEEGNPDYLPSNAQLINFFKRRKVAEITGEIQQYQNQPYCYTVESKIRHFLENLNPFGDMSDTEISNYLFNKSLEIEPRQCKQVPKFPRRWPNLSLKSPGIKTKSASKQLVNAVNNAMNSTLNSAANINKSDDSKSEDSSKSDNDFSVFAPVQIGTGQSSPTLSPVSPAPANSTSNWFPQQQSSAPPPTHSRTSSVSSVMSVTSSIFGRNLPAQSSGSAAPQQHAQRYGSSHHNTTTSQQNSGTTCGSSSTSASSGSTTPSTIISGCGANSPGPHSPASPCSAGAVTTATTPHHHHNHNHPHQHQYHHSAQCNSVVASSNNGSGSSCCCCHEMAPPPHSPRSLLSGGGGGGCSTPPPPPPPLPPRRRRDSPEIGSPGQQNQMKPPLDLAKDCPPPSPPPPLPPRREPGPSPNSSTSSHHHHMPPSLHHPHPPPPPHLHHHHVPPSHSHSHPSNSSSSSSHSQQQQRMMMNYNLPSADSLSASSGSGGGGGTLPPPPRLNPTHMSQLHMRRHSAAVQQNHNVMQQQQQQPQVPSRNSSHGGGSMGMMMMQNRHPNGGTPTITGQPPSISPRYDNSAGQITPKLPPKPAARSADMVTGPMFQYPSTTSG